MRVFLAGATGAIGRPLAERLLGAGHEVTGTTRSPGQAAALRERGIDAVVVDALDAEALRAAVLTARPEVVVNQLTALPQRIDPRRYARDLAATNRLRREAGPVLARAAAEAGARRIVAQSISFIARPEGPPVLDEDAPLFTDAPPGLRDGVEGAADLEHATLTTPGIEGLVLRYGFFYGPGTAFGPGGSQAQDVARRRLPVVGAGTGIFSFVHVDDAADATVLALDRGGPGVYHVTDDEPLAQRDWLPLLAGALGARPPRRVPVWLARLAAGPVAGQAVSMRGAANAKARRELGWVPGHPSVRTGFAEVFGAQAGSASAGSGSTASASTASGSTASGSTASGSTASGSTASATSAASTASGSSPPASG
ncbi:MAG: NAD(P)-dependent oxidoreductase [Solirubrobacteraceae bacterium]|nr:NAD(P)-dependent oxidoreductase [Solirubrobacteraceae bacterium]